MRPAKLLSLAVLFTAVFLAGAAVARQDKPLREMSDVPPDEMATLQMQMMEMAAPTHEHSLLAKYAGKFDQKIKFWMMPGADPMEIEGTLEQEMVLGGRFLKSEASMSFMGMPMDSINMWGFDSRNKVFTSVGFDTMGTYFVTASGTYDEKTRTASLSGMDEDHNLGIIQRYQFDLQFVDDDTLKVSLTFTNMSKDGPFKLMEMTATRRKE